MTAYPLSYPARSLAYPWPPTLVLSAVLIWQKGAGETGEETSSRFAKVGPAKADLINLLNRAGVSAKPGILDLSAKSRNTIRIEVGRKPQPSSTWGRQLGLVPVIESRQEDRNSE